MARIKSTKVNIYPSAYRGKDGTTETSKIFDPESRLYTEQNITRPLLLEKNYIFKDETNNSPKSPKGSYVISSSINDLGFEFIVYGYYFKVKELQSLLANLTGTDFYACIELKDKNTNLTDANTAFAGTSLSPVKESEEELPDDTLDYKELGGSTFNFSGLSITSDPGEEALVAVGKHYLWIAHKTGNNAYEVPAVSRIKIEAESIHGGDNKALNKFLNTEEIQLANSLHGDKASLNTAEGSFEIEKIYSKEILNHEDENLAINVENGNLSINVSETDSDTGNFNLEADSDINITSNTGNINLQATTGEIEYNYIFPNDLTEPVSANPNIICTRNYLQHMLDNEVIIGGSTTNISLTGSKIEANNPLTIKATSLITLKANSLITLDSPTCITGATQLDNGLYLSNPDPDDNRKVSLSVSLEESVAPSRVRLNIDGANTIYSLAAWITLPNATADLKSINATSKIKTKSLEVNTDASFTCTPTFSSGLKVTGGQISCQHLASWYSNPNNYDLKLNTKRLCFNDEYSYRNDVPNTKFDVLRINGSCYEGQAWELDVYDQAVYRHGSFWWREGPVRGQNAGLHETWIGGFKCVCHGSQGDFSQRFKLPVFAHTESGDIHDRNNWHTVNMGQYIIFSHPNWVKARISLDYDGGSSSICSYTSENYGILLVNMYQATDDYIYAIITDTGDPGNSHVIKSWRKLSSIVEDWYSSSAYSAYITGACYSY